MMLSIGDYLRQLRGKMTYREAAERSGLSHSYIRYLEMGKRPGTNAPINPTPETLMSLSKAYNHPYEDLMKRAGYIEGSKEEDSRDPVNKLIEYLDAELTNDEIKERMNFRIDNIPLTDEDVDEFIAFVRAKRSMKKQLLSSKNNER